jgi:hypothetical protein
MILELEIQNKEKSRMIFIEVNEDSFNIEKPIKIKYIDKRGKIKYYHLRITNKAGLCLN